MKAHVKRKSVVYTYNGLNRVETDEAEMGDIIAFAGIDDINIGETVADAENPGSIAIHLHRRTNIVYGVFRK